MKLELKEIESTNNGNTSIVSNFKNFYDILDCFERQNNYFKSLEKDLTIPESQQLIYIFLFIFVLFPSANLFLLGLKVGVTFLIQKFSKSMKFNFDLATFFVHVFSFTSIKNKTIAHKIKIYQTEKTKFLNDFFIIPVNKEIILKFLHDFYTENQYRLSDNVFSEINNIKVSIENENFENALNQILQFKKRIYYINDLNKN